MRAMNKKELTKLFSASKILFFMFLIGSLLNFTVYFIINDARLGIFSLILFISAMELHNLERHTATRLEIQKNEL